MKQRQKSEWSALKRVLRVLKIFRKPAGRCFWNTGLKIPDFLKQFWKYKLFNAVLILLLILTIFAGRFAFDIPALLGRAASYAQERPEYGSLYSIARAEEVNNYNYNILYSDGEEQRNREMYQFLCDHYEVISAFQKLTEEPAQIGGRPVSVYYCNQAFLNRTLSPMLLEKAEEGAPPEGEYIPVILGGGFTGYGAGDIVDGQYYVAGMLEPGAFFYNLRDNYEPVFTDGMVFQLFKPEDMDFLGSSMMVSESKLLAEGPGSLEPVNDYGEQIGMDRLRFIKDADQIAVFWEQEREFVQFEFCILAALTLQLAAVSYIFMNLELEKMKRELELKFMLGSSRRRIRLSLFGGRAVCAAAAFAGAAAAGSRLRLTGTVLWVTMGAALLAYLLYCLALLEILYRREND